MSVCFFIGHRDTPETVIPLLDAAIERHLTQCGVAEFVVGKYGNFDRLAAQSLRQAKQRHPEIRLTLLLAYYDSHKPIELPSGFDESLFPEGMERTPRRAAIVCANRYMIQHCNYLIAYDAGRIGNTRELVAYAQYREGKGLLLVENLFCQVYKR